MNTTVTFRSPASASPAGEDEVCPERTADAPRSAAAPSGESVRDVELRYHALLDGLPERVFFKDRDSVFVSVNRAFAGDLGMEPEALTGKSDYDFFPRELADKYCADDRRIMEQRQSETLEEMNVAGGQARVVKVVKTPVLNRAGAVVGLLGLFTDITQLRQTEQALAQERDFLRALLENTPDRIYFKDAHLRYVWCGLSHVKRLGRQQPGEVIGHTDLDFLPEEEARTLHEQEERIIRTGVGMVNQVQPRAADDGPETWSLVNKVAIRDKDGRVIGLIGISRDITKLMQAEEELKRSQRFLHSVIENLPIMVFIKNAADLRFVLWNKAGEQLTGHPREAFLGKTDYEFFPKEEADSFTARDRETLAAGQLLDVPEEIIHTRDKRLRFLHTKKIPICDEHGQPQYLLGISEDITERKAAEEKLRSFAAQLEQNNRELQEFAYVASHDLQEPLRKVCAFGDRLKAKYAAALGEDGRDYLERMQNAARRMQGLITDLLAYSRVTTQAKPFERADLTAIAKAVLSDLEVRIEQVQAQVTVEPLPFLEADPIQMRQLLQNLIGNALKFHRKDVPPRVRIYAAPLSRDKPGAPATPPDQRRNLLTAAAAWQILVEDNGIGFDEKYRDRIFGVFQRLHGRGEYEGSGVGLAICRKIAVRHGGDITARSQPGHGATFIVTLPLQQAQPEHLP